MKTWFVIVALISILYLHIIHNLKLHHLLHRDKNWNIKMLSDSPSSCVCQIKSPHYSFIAHWELIMINNATENHFMQIFQRKFFPTALNTTLDVKWWCTNSQIIFSSYQPRHGVYCVREIKLHSVQKDVQILSNFHSFVILDS